MESIIISLVCIGVIGFIIFTQCNIKKLEFKSKDLSLIILVFSFILYINGYEKLFLIFLLGFIIIYFVPIKNLQNLYLKISKKEVDEEKKIKKDKKKKKDEKKEEIEKKEEDDEDTISISDLSDSIENEFNINKND